jgi:hypothetical protein
MIIKNDTIEELFTDSGPFDEEEVVRALKHCVTIQRSTKEIFIKDMHLSVEKKVLAFCLAKKLLKFKKLVDSEMITAREFYERTKIKKGSIDPAFKALKEKGLLVGKREYEIPTHQISAVIVLLAHKKTHE